MSRQRPSGWLDWSFTVALALKGIDGLLELVGGFLLLAVPRHTLEAWLVALTQHELSEDPNDVIATTILAGVQGLSDSSQTFYAWYLLAHGVVKVVLVAAVLRSRLWAYPWMIGFLAMFIAYQGYRFVLDPTLGMGLLTGFDVVVLWLTHREYGRQRSRLQAAR